MRCEKNIMLNIEWADKYTKYLKGDEIKLPIIDNLEL